MKYTDRAKTPLKWHHFLTYVGLPLTALSAVYQLLRLINELFGLRLGGMNVILAPVLKGLGVTISNLGGYFWYVTAYFIFHVLLTILIVYVCFGFFQWKEQARKGWLYYLLLTTLETGFFGYQCFVLYHNASSQFNAIWQNLLSQNNVAATGVSGSILLFTILSMFIVMLLMLLLNVAYYHKRKMLFTETYVAPDYSGMDMQPQTAPVKQEEYEVKQPEPVQAPAEPAPAPVEEAVPAQPEQTVPAVEAEPVKAEESAPAEALKQEKILKYCPNCGAELGEHDAMFCTHCGAKLN